MATHGTGNHSGSNAQMFMGLTKPVHLPILTTDDGSTSRHLPKGQVTTVPEVTGYTDLSPSLQGIDFGMVDHFSYVINDTETLLNCTLCVKLDGLNAAGANGKNPRYPDDVLCQAIEKITFLYGKELQVIEGDELHFRRVQETPEAELARLARLQGLGLDDTERAINAQTARWYYLEIPFWWCMKPENAWHQYAFQRITRITIHWRKPEYILQQDGVDARPTPKTAANSPYIMDHFLRFKTACMTESARREYTNRVKAQGKAGWLYLIGDAERVQFQIPKSMNTTVLQLNTFSKFDYNLRFVARSLADITPSYLRNRRFVTWDINDVALDIGGRRYFNETDRHWLKYNYNQKMFDGNPELAIWNIPLGTEMPQAHDHAVGGFDLSNASTPQITINWPDHADDDLQIDFFAYGHNYIRLVISGDETGAELVQPL